MRLAGIYLNGSAPNASSALPVLNPKPKEDISVSLTEVTPSVSKTEKSENKSLEIILSEFKELVEEICALNAVNELASWDQKTYMPSKGSEERGWQMMNISKISHRTFTSEKMGELLKQLEEPANFNKLNKIDQALVKEASTNYKKAKNVPLALVQEISETTSNAYNVWVDAKKNNNFNDFAPYLEKIVSLKKRYAEYIRYTGSPYNALLDDYEPGMTTEKLNEIFSKLKKELVPIIKAITESKVKINDDFLNKSFDRNKLLAFVKVILEQIGFDFSKGRMDETEHPFCISLAPNDGRITTHTYENDLLSSISAPTHETGHWLYGEGMDKDLYKTFLYDGASLGIHESQSRLQETIIGQGLPFWKHFFPILKQTFPEELKGVELEDFYKAVNIVEPSFIRIKADEVTYQMHIIIRWEIERDLFEGKIQAKDLPDIWNNKMQDYLGITPETNSQGVLQDVHWSMGAFGYFPTYTLGNLYAAQFYNTAKKEIPNLEEKFSNGDFMTLRNWLREKIHKYGKTETPSQIAKRVTGEELNPDYFIAYIKDKYSKIYP